MRGGAAVVGPGAPKLAPRRPLPKRFMLSGAPFNLSTLPSDPPTVRAVQRSAFGKAYRWSMVPAIKWNDFIES